VAIGFTHPKTEERFLLVGSHTSVVREGHKPSVKAGCAGCVPAIAKALGHD
jgi:hypothetical protein